MPAHRRPNGLKEFESLDNLLGRGFIWIRNGHIASMEVSEDDKYLVTTVYKRKGNTCRYRGQLKYSLNPDGENVIHG